MANNYNQQTFYKMLLSNVLGDQPQAVTPIMLNTYYAIYLSNVNPQLDVSAIQFPSDEFYNGGAYMLGNLFKCNLQAEIQGSIVPVYTSPLDVASMNVVSFYILYPFLYRVPYADFNTLTNRIIAILNKYSINVYNYIIKYIQLQNIQKLLNQNASKMLNYQTNTNTSINTSNSANEVGGTSFNPVTGGSVSVTMPKASSNDTINIDGIANAQASNSNYETNQQESQGTSHNLTEQSLTIYKQIKFEMDNCLQPILKAVNSLFYIFDQGDDYTW